MYVLGISAFYHDSAACLIGNGQIIAAAQQERFSRVKHDASFPSDAIKYCLDEAQISPSQIADVVFYEKPFLKFERILETHLSFSPRGFKSFASSMPIWIKEKLFQKSLLVNCLKSTLGDSCEWRDRLLFSEHHLSHAASAYFPSPFEDAAILTLDGVGEWTTGSVAIGAGKHLEIIKEMKFPHSLGLLYSAFTYYCGFKVNSGEYKLMGLAPYGQPKYARLIKDTLVNIADDGSIQLNMAYFNYSIGTTMTSSKFNALFGAKPRIPESPITERIRDIAASIQAVTEEIVIKIARNIAQSTGQKNLCLAGGVALNCVANGALVRENIFDQIWIQPAAGDAGCALGAALAVWHLHHKNERVVKQGQDAMRGSYLGPSFSDDAIESELQACGAVYKRIDTQALIEQVSAGLVDQKAIGWMQGRMEFGPRALGGRSIIADPRSPKMQKLLNLKVKYRESFRPFAPSVLRESASEWFDCKTPSPYMLVVANIHENRRVALDDSDSNLAGFERLKAVISEIPAVTHVDYSSRFQTVNKDTNPLYHALLSRFNEKTGCPLVINTSFNVRGEPIVCSPTDAFRCFMGTELDMLAVGNFLLLKEDQCPTLTQQYQTQYDLD